MVPAPKTLAFRPLLRQRAHEAIAEQLRDAILDERFKAGQKLPPERELALEFGVNRTTVREAIKSLEGLGLLSVRQGDGATVQPLAEAALGVLAPMIFHGGRVDRDLMQELQEVMMPLLFEMGRLAIERHSPEHLDELRHLRAEIADETRSQETRFAAAREVLVLLADMSRNRVWQMLARRTRDLLASPPLVEMRRRLRRDPARVVPIMDRCLAAIDARRPDEALEALRDVIAMVGEAEAPTETQPSRKMRNPT